MQEQPKIIIYYPQQQQQQENPQIETPKTETPKLETQQPKEPSNNNEDTQSLIFFILGFFSIFFWFIGWYLFRKSTNLSAKKFANLSMCFFCAVLILDFIGIFFYILLGSSCH
jgi:ATP-dependent Zn protease